MKWLLVFLGMLVSPIIFADLPNLHWAQEELVGYHNSGSYMTEFSAVDQQALDYLSTAVTHNTAHKKLAIVLDIDETSLSNWPVLQKGFDDKFDDASVLYHQFVAPALNPTLALYRYAIDHGVSVFFITGRSFVDTKGTIKNLKQAGYTQWQALILRNKDEGENTVLAEVYKTAHRKAIVESGYDIVINVGDQWSDLSGGYADASYKLPNPFYYIA